MREPSWYDKSARDYIAGTDKTTQEETETGATTL
jgi:hypothetical protein